MTNKGHRKKVTIVTILIVVFIIPMILYASIIFRKPDFSNIINDSSIIKNNTLLLHPAIVPDNWKVWYIKEFNKTNWTLLRNGSIPYTDSKVILTVLFDKLKTVDRHWYGDNCKVNVAGIDTIYSGKAKKSAKDWDEKIGTHAYNIEPSFTSDFYVDSTIGNFILVASMDIEYPYYTGEGTLWKSNYFNNESKKLMKTFNFTVLSEEKFVSTINYICWKNRFSNYGIFCAFYLVISLLLFWLIYSLIFNPK
jgi:hypothetical protein